MLLQPWTKERLGEGGGGAPTSMNPQVVLQVPSCGELFPAAQLWADEGLLPVVSPHVHFQPLKDVETFPTIFCRTNEGTVIPGRERNSGETQQGRDPLQKFGGRQLPSDISTDSISDVSR